MSLMLVNANRQIEKEVIVRTGESYAAQDKLEQITVQISESIINSAGTEYD